MDINGINGAHGAYKLYPEMEDRKESRSAMIAQGVLKNSHNPYFYERIEATQLQESAIPDTVLRNIRKII